ncbi:hypothetical protein BT96DRAFT_1024605 [Gymnopus androsaceus JB14]|uniref:Integral membrane protein n=1 Tax=Gymnopus androsaceus JB14 TaxID=1447944 RepID=A0A6A4GXX9_9AGAR|nr:hypothetical protein BT96DRAFT_1024605 [Gymnopus androsaceus JB14]
MEKSLNPVDITENGNEHRWHLQLDPSLTIHSPNNPFSGNFFHPTSSTIARKDPNSDEEFLWKSRDHRKNRHVKYNPNQDNESRQGSNLLVGLGHMFRIEYWNVSWWVAMSFTIGSVVWVVNGFYSFLPFVDLSVAKSTSAVGWTAWVGATIFEVGSVLGMLEAWNREDTANFGWGVRKALGHDDPEAGGNMATSNSSDTIPGSRSESEKESKPKPKRQWIWFSTDAKYWHEMGFLAAFAQFCGASIFWISGFTALPSIQNTIMTETGVLDGVFWTPQVIGGSGFVISATFIMLETQKRWYIPTPLSIGMAGWSLEFYWWNWVRALRCSWVRCAGSVLQWYEAVNSV